MKKVTVWGGGGFLGSHICDALTLEGHRVTIVDIADSLWKKEGQSMIIADLMDYDEVVKTVKNADYVFNKPRDFNLILSKVFEAYTDSDLKES